MDKFTILPEHIKLLKEANIGWNDCEFGAPSIDCKRPFGNSDVFTDIAKILEIPIDEDNGPNDEQQHEMYQIYEQLGTVLKIILSTSSVESGEYKNIGSPYSPKWQKITE